MDILFISRVRYLQSVLVGLLRQADGNQARGASCRETVEAVLAEFTPGLIVVDASHPDGAALVATVRARHPKAAVVVLAMSDRDEEFLAWANAGISGYLGPDTSTDDLLSTVRRVGAGEVACPPRLTALLLRLAARPNERAAAPAGLSTLTSREQEIAELLADGLSNKLIARRLQVALPTVKNHVHSILGKWECQSRGEAAARYRRQAQGDAPQGSGKLVELRSPALPPGRPGFPMRTCGFQHRAPGMSGQRAA